VTIGISKKRLREWKRISKQKGLSGVKSDELLDNLIAECEELNPWLPIENAPKDKELLLSSSGQRFVGEWCEQHGRWEDNCGCGIYPDKYKELPEDPNE